MRRLLPILGLVAVAALAVVLAVGATGAPDTSKRYEVELDNAFGMVEGGDVKVAGVRAGQIESLDLDRRDMRALLKIRIDDTGFGDLRKDVFCEARQQSLIGEYFLDCKPGTKRERLPEGARIPVQQTASTIPVDLVQDISRRPVRERASIILSELGAGLAARGGDLNETIRRASPALREVNRVLAALHAERRTIRDLYRDAEAVVGELAENRRDVVRFLREARDTTGAQAAEAEALRRQFDRFPTFLRELRPTLAELGATADEQGPALTEISAQAPKLRALLRSVEAFSGASRPAIRTLGDAAQAGRPAVRSLRPRIAELGTAARPLPELATNAAITLEHIDDPRNRSEADERAGRGKDGGYSGLEALLRYIHAQSQAINTFDEDSYFLKVSLFNDSACGNYADEKTARNEANARCRAWLGPNQPGITTPDPTPPRRERGGAASAREAGGRASAPADAPRRAAPSERSAAVPVAAPPAPSTDLGRAPVPALPALPDARDTAAGPQALLDFLLRP